MPLQRLFGLACFVAILIPAAACGNDLPTDNEIAYSAAQSTPTSFTAANRGSSPTQNFNKKKIQQLKSLGYVR